MESATRFKPHRLLVKYQHLLGVVAHNWLPAQQKSPGSDLWKKNYIQPCLVPQVRALQTGHRGTDIATVRHEALGKGSVQAGRGSVQAGSASHSCRDCGRIKKKTLTPSLIASQNPLSCLALVRSRSQKQGPSAKQKPWVCPACTLHFRSQHLVLLLKIQRYVGSHCLKSILFFAPINNQ